MSLRFAAANLVWGLLPPSKIQELGRLHHVDGVFSFGLLRRDRVLPVGHAPGIDSLPCGQEKFLLRRVAVLPRHDLSHLRGDLGPELGISWHLCIKRRWLRSW